MRLVAHTSATTGRLACIRIYRHRALAPAVTVLGGVSVDASEYHRLEHRIRAHVLIYWLALLLVRTAETHTQMTWHRITTELGRVHAITQTGDAGTAVHTTQLNTTQSSILSTCKVPPPVVTHIKPL